MSHHGGTACTLLWRKVPGKNKGRLTVQPSSQIGANAVSGQHLHSPGQVREFSVPALRRLGGLTEF